MKSVAACLLLSFSLSALAAEVKNAKDLYTQLVKTFPTAWESIGGFSSAISMTDVTCAASRTTRGMKHECSGTGWDGSPLSSTALSSAKLYKAMIKAGASVDTTSEPGTTYAQMSSVECSRLECKPTRPSDCRNAKVEYSCEVKP